ncbi:MAG TPA: hypothetical protein VHW01_06530 [Polyangiaceae bacterium]|nr:hypothetical protein [Polyangiaceae bacterium]
MSAANEEKKVDEARSALVSDIRDLKRAGQEITGKAASMARWIAMGAVGLLAIGVLISRKPRRRLLGPPPLTLLEGAARAIALSAVRISTRSVVSRAVNKALPERAPVAGKQ